MERTHPPQDGRFGQNTTDVGMGSERALQDAVAPWWSGGGTASRLINVLLAESATASEARVVAERLAERVEAGRTYTADVVIREELEYARARAALSRQESRVSLAAIREQDALSREWCVIDRELAAAQVNMETLYSIYAGVGSETLRTEWRSLLVEDWACLTRTQVPACLE